MKPSVILTRLSQEDHLDADSQALEFQAGPVSPTKTNITAHSVYL